MAEASPYLHELLSVKHSIITTALLFLMVLSVCAQPKRGDECARTSGMQIYSNATYIEEAGDVVGLELALTVRPDRSVNALLYDYEGVPTNDGVLLDGRIAGTTLTLDGIWVQHLHESSGREIIHKVPIALRGVVNEKSFVGSVQINGGSQGSVRLLRTETIWLCRASSKAASPPK